jgi:U32 family peptidase
MLSNYLTGRDANRGDCAHPCRYSYRLVEEKRPGQYYPVEEDKRGTYIFNSQDLCLLGRLPELVATGVDSLKIEGRMKSVGYVGGVVRVYRAVLDWLNKEVQSGKQAVDLIVPQHFADELLKLGTRGQTENFFDSPPDSSDMLYDRMRVEQEWAPVGIVRQAGPLVIETRNVLEVGNTIEYLGRSCATLSCIVTRMSLEDGTPLERANPGTIVVLTIEPPIPEPEPISIFRKKMSQ